MCTNKKARRDTPNQKLKGFENPQFLTSVCQNAKQNKAEISVNQQ